MKTLGYLKYLLTTDNCYQEALEDVRKTNLLVIDDGTEPPIKVPAIVVFSKTYCPGTDEDRLDETYVYPEEFETK